MASERTHEHVDVLIGGGGFAGLALAIALRQGLGPSFSVTVADPALGSAARRRARIRHRRGRAPAVRDHRRVAPGRGAAHSRHGRHRQPPAGCGAADVPHLRRRPGAGRAIRAHGRKRSAARRPDGKGEAGGRCATIVSGGGHLAADAKCSRTFVARSLTCRRRRARGWHRNIGAACGRRRRRAFVDPPACRHCQPWLELRPVRHRHHGGARARS